MKSGRIDLLGVGMVMVMGAVPLTIACQRSASLGESRLQDWPMGQAPCHRSAAEICNDRDDDCDGQSDEGDVCADRCRVVLVQPTCALRGDGALFCWLHSGSGTEFRALSPVRVPLEEPVTQVSGRCARGVSGRVWCWGVQGESQLDRPPAQVWALGNTVAAVVSPQLLRLPLTFDGVDLVCALRSGVAEGTVWCWPHSQDPAAARPVPLEGLEDPTVQLAVGAGICALSAHGTVSCSFQGAPWRPVTPVEALGDDNVEIGFGHHLCVRKRDGRVVCLGPPHCPNRSDGGVHCTSGNRHGELGTGDAVPATAPLMEATALGGNVVRLVVAGGGSTCALRADGSVVCVGTMFRRPETRDDRGFIGPEPFTPPGLERDVVDLAAGCALKADGRLWCWNRYAGDGTHNLHVAAIPIDLCAQGREGGS